MSKPCFRNLFDDIPSKLSEELTEVLLDSAAVRIERIVSMGHASPEDFWYDQPQREWVVLLSGTARVQFEGEESALDMEPGDFVLIEAHRKHRVVWTSRAEPSVWLAIHFD